MSYVGSPDGMAKKLQEFQTSKLSQYINHNYLKSGDWCNYNKIYTYDNGNYTEIFDFKSGIVYFTGEAVTLPQKDFKCEKTYNNFADGTDMYVATLTAKEVLHSAGKIYTYSKPDALVYSTYLDGQWWTLSSAKWIAGSSLTDASNYSECFVFGPGNNTGNSIWDDKTYEPDALILAAEQCAYTYPARRAVNLKSGIEIVKGGRGTITNPYVIAEK